MSEPQPTAAQIAARLAAPFAPAELHTRPGQGGKQLTYIKAAAVMDRLDAVVGIDGWRDSYTPLPDGSFLCRLSIRIGGTWISKTDVGSPGEQAKQSAKAAVSDALKRAAAKFGVARSLKSDVRLAPAPTRQAAKPPAATTPAPRPVLRGVPGKTDARFREIRDRFSRMGVESTREKLTCMAKWIGRDLPADASDLTDSEIARVLAMQDELLGANGVKS